MQKRQERQRGGTSRFGSVCYNMLTSRIQNRSRVGALSGDARLFSCPEKEANMPKTLREHRAVQGVTLRELAKASGVAATTLLYIDKSTRKPNCSTMRAVASALEVGVRDVAEFDAALDARLKEAAA